MHVCSCLMTAKTNEKMANINAIDEVYTYINGKIAHPKLQQISELGFVVGLHVEGNVHYNWKPSHDI